ncbi:MAG: hypothetical protein AMXMBFR13_11980 [Phycisphaerae bacterium]
MQTHTVLMNRLARMGQLGGLLATAWVIRSSLAQAPATSPVARQPHADVRLRVFEVLRPADQMDEVDAAQLSVPRGGRGRRDQVPVGDIHATLDLSTPASVMTGTRLPVAGRAGRISYESLGVRATLEGEWNLDVDPPVAHLKLKMRLDGSAAWALTADERKDLRRRTVDREVDVPEGKPVVVPLDDTPVQLTAGAGTALMRFALIQVRRPAAQNAVAAEGSETPSAGPSSVQVELFTASCDPQKLTALDLSDLNQRAPSGAEILETLEACGEAYQLGGLDASFDLSAGFKSTSGQRVPSVQDVNVSSTGMVTPSVTYEEVGTIITIKPGRWRHDSGDWAADVMMEIQASAIGKSGVEVAAGVTLPTFTQFEVERQVNVVSGRPQYLFASGAPSPPGLDGRASVCVVRLVLTRLEEK